MCQVMPVRTFRFIEEMNTAPFQTTPGSAFDRFVRHCSRYRTLAPRRYPRGVFKFRTIAEAQRARGLAARPGESEAAFSHTSPPRRTR
jgi:hypothetical protein